MTVPTKDAMAMLASGRINVSHTIIALQWLALNREAVRQAWGAGSSA